MPEQALFNLSVLCDNTSVERSIAMEVGEQIKKYRGELKLSQEAFAEKVYVSRQTISNWETGKNYPDINSLLRMSEIFGVSVDVLLKGDVEEMKKIINEADIDDFQKWSRIFTVLFFMTLITPVPLARFLKWAGLGIWAILAAVTMGVALTVEKKKSVLNIQTYREITAFLEGKTLDEIETVREEAKRPYQKILLMLAFAVIGLVISILMGFLLK